MANNFNLKGTISGSFQIGVNGPTIYQGTGAPDNSVGTSGDIYFFVQGTASDMYIKAGTWQASGFGSGNLTAVTAGDGLSGGTITSSGTIAVLLNGGTSSGLQASSSGLNVSVGDGIEIVSGSLIASLGEGLNFNGGEITINLPSNSGLNLAGTGLTVNVDGSTITNNAGTLSVGTTGVIANTYGASGVFPIITVNAQGQITSATTGTISSNTITYIAGSGTATASGQYGFAGGLSAQAIGNYSLALGDYSQAQGLQSVAVGVTALAVGTDSTSIGQSGTAVGTKSIQIGCVGTAGGANSIFIGANGSAMGNNSIAISGNGSGAALGSNSIVLGYGTATGSGQVVINGTTLTNGTGTVTSISGVGSNGVSVSGSPITGAGTLDISLLLGSGIYLDTNGSLRSNFINTGTNLTTGSTYSATGTDGAKYFVKATGSAFAFSLPDASTVADQSIAIYNSYSGGALTINTIGTQPGGAAQIMYGYGKFGSGVTNVVLQATDFVLMLSDGANWLVLNSSSDLNLSAGTGLSYTNGGTLNLSPTGVSAGTYTFGTHTVVVNTYGQITSIT